MLKDELQKAMGTFISADSGSRQRPCRCEAVLVDLQRRLGPVKTVPRRASSLMVPVLLASKSAEV